MRAGVVQMGEITIGVEPVGLCASCVYARVIHSDRGSVFWQCLLSARDSHFPKYPRLPVLCCDGYEELSAPVQGDSSADDLPGETANADDEVAADSGR